jgi:hypothetical protein
LSELKDGDTNDGTVHPAKEGTRPAGAESKDKPAKPARSGGIDGGKDPAAAGSRDDDAQRIRADPVASDNITGAITAGAAGGQPEFSGDPPATQDDAAKTIPGGPGHTAGGIRRPAVGREPEGPGRPSGVPVHRESAVSATGEARPATGVEPPAAKVEPPAVRDRSDTMTKDAEPGDPDLGQALKTAVSHMAKMERDISDLKSREAEKDKIINELSTRVYHLEHPGQDGVKDPAIGATRQSEQSAKPEESKTGRAQRRPISNEGVGLAATTATNIVTVSALLMHGDVLAATVICGAAVNQILSIVPYVRERRENAH